MSEGCFTWSSLASLPRNRLDIGVTLDRGAFFIPAPPRARNTRPSALSGGFRMCATATILRSPLTVVRKFSNQNETPVNAGEMHLLL